jgi:hypothetical protein
MSQANHYDVIIIGTGPCGAPSCGVHGGLPAGVPTPVRRGAPGAGRGSASAQLGLISFFCRLPSRPPVPFSACSLVTGNCCFSDPSPLFLMPLRHEYDIPYAGSFIMTS